MKKKKIIHCEKCCGEITDIDDLVVTNNFLSIVPYHEECFSKEVKGLSSIFVGNTPINGTMSNVSTILAVIFGVIVLFIQELRYISVVSLLFLCIRVYSWFQYERHL
ncbi:hypothetical protein [Clostridium sp.]|uniref:hypothetical protein n=1 Tax=Clostridium sp. TaxID=1506 RepID=UPI001A46871F|nr:hypothetical protein [Clostridium sp.]MBK5240445.1 hypothetical protein [Clostridium sp.]